MKVPETKLVTAIKCVNCGYWNVPKISKDGTIIPIKICKNRDCRTMTFAGKPDMRKSEKAKESGRNLYNKTIQIHGKRNYSGRKPKVVISHIYNHADLSNKFKSGN